MKKILLTVIMIAVSKLLAAQEKTLSIWQTVQMPVKLHEKLSLHTDAGYRTLGVSFLPRQFLIRTGFRYHFSKQTDVAAGIALFYSKTSLKKEEHELGKEFRLWQEVQQQVRLSEHTRLIFRLRTEQRFFESTSIMDRYHAYRFRYRITFQQLLNTHLQLQAGFEYMHQLQNEKNSFNQYRLQPSVVWKLNNHLQLQTMLMLLKTRNEVQQALWATWIYNLN